MPKSDSLVLQFFVFKMSRRDKYLKISFVLLLPKLITCWEHEINQFDCSFESEKKTNRTNDNGNITLTHDLSSLGSKYVGQRVRRQIGLDEPLPYPSEVLDGLFSRRLFNSTMNYIIPLFEVMLPVRTESGSTIQLAMQAFLGLFSAIAWIATVAIPLILTSVTPYGLRKRESKSLFGHRDNFNDTYIIEYSVTSNKFSSLFNEKMRKDVGLEWKPCLFKTICQAHRNPKIYRGLALPLLFLFPPDANSPTGSAAYIGSKNDGEECGDVYKCFFDVLDLIAYYLYHYKK